MLITLLVLWLFAIVGPSVITLLSDNNKSIITLNLNEEEQQEQGKKNIGEKIAFQDKSSNFQILSHLQNYLSYSFYLLSKSDIYIDIVLPPPKIV